MKFTPFIENRIKETFTHFFHTMHLSAFQISLVDTNGSVAHILRDQYTHIEHLEKTGSLNDKNMSDWLDEEVKSRIESEISSVA
jgi:hypothetical protein